MTQKIKAAGLDTRAALKKQLHPNYAPVDRQTQAGHEWLLSLGREHQCGLQLLLEFAFFRFEKQSANRCCVCGRMLTEHDAHGLFYALGPDGADFGLCCAEHPVNTAADISKIRFALSKSLDAIEKLLQHWQNVEFIDEFLRFKTNGKPFIRRLLLSEWKTFESQGVVIPGSRAVVYESGKLRLLQIPFPWKDEMEFAVRGAVALEALDIERAVDDGAALLPLGMIEGVRK